MPSTIVVPGRMPPFSPTRTTEPNPTRGIAR